MNHYWKKDVMYNRIYKTIYLKQFGFQFGHLTDHAIIQFVDQIFEGFENNLYTMGVPVDFSKRF